MTLLEAFALVLRCAISAVFIFYGVTKLFTSKIAFEAAISGYKLLPVKFVRPVAIVLPVVELVLGSAFLFARTNMFMGMGLLLLLLVFEITIGSAIVRSLKIDCGCSGGGTIRESLKFSFSRNLALIGGILLFEFLSGRSGIQGENFLAEIVLFALTFLFGLSLALQRKEVRVIVAQKVSQGGVENKRRMFLGKVGTVSVGLLGLWFLNRQDIAFAKVVPPCVCACLLDVYELIDCGTYCPAGCSCPCSAPVFGVYDEACCPGSEDANLYCDTSVSIVGYAPCC